MSTKELRKLQHANVSHGRFAMTDSLYDKVSSNLKACVLKELKSVAVKSRMPILKAISSKIQVLRKQLVCKSTVKFNEDGEPEEN